MVNRFARQARYSCASTSRNPRQNAFAIEERTLAHLRKRRNDATTRRRRIGCGILGIAATLVALGAAPAGAADADGRFRIMGSGNLSCGQWLNDRRDNSTSGAQSEMWIAGYLTAYNQFIHKEQDVTAPYDGAFVLDWIDSYCQQQPGDSLILAARSLLEDLRRRQ